MNQQTTDFCKLLDAYFDALVRPTRFTQGAHQTEIDKARLAIVAEYERVS